MRSTASTSVDRSGDVPGRDATLSRSSQDDLARARGGRDTLLASARSLVHAIAHDPDLADCNAAGCALAVDGDPGRCSLVHRLAGVEDGSAVELSVEQASQAFDAALRGAVEAIRRCRQTEHGSGRCWFSSLPGADGCGAVLRAAHQLG